jgi:hypothetical protein
MKTRIYSDRPSRRAYPIDTRDLPNRKRDRTVMKMPDAPANGCFEI